MRRMLALGVFAVFLMAACGGSKSGPSSGGSSPQGGGSGATLTVNTGSAGAVGTVLVDAQGRTLYHLKTETGSAIQCSGSCTATWPPLLVTGTAAPKGGTGVTGSLGTIKRPDGGTQVTYQGLTLYRYAGDSKAGQANGQGIGGVWFAVTPSGLSGPKSSSGGSGGGGYGGGGSGSSPGSGSGGYGY